MSKISVFSSCYLAPIEWYAHFLRADDVVIDIHEYFLKQSYRSRALILGAQGPQKLIVPVNRKAKTAVRDTSIANEFPWVREHLRSLQAAYRNAPYFEFYEMEIQEIYNKDFHFLAELNMTFHTLIIKLLKAQKGYQISEAYIENPKFDFRDRIKPKKASSILNPPSYPQVFQERYGFVENLSILDLLFNLGPESTSYLNSLELR